MIISAFLSSLILLTPHAVNESRLAQNSYHLLLAVKLSQMSTVRIRKGIVGDIEAF